MNDRTTYEVTLELRGVDVRAASFLARMDAPAAAALAERATLVRDTRGQFGIFETTASSYDDAVRAVTTELQAIAPELEAAVAA